MNEKNCSGKNNSILCIYSGQRLANRIFKKLVNNHYHFVVLVNSEDINQTQCADKVRYMTEIEYLGYLPLLKKSNLNKTKHYKYCFVAIQIQSYYFKRLWLAQKRIESFLPANLTICNAVLVKPPSAAQYNITYFYKSSKSCNDLKKVALVLLPCAYGDMINMAHIIQRFITEKNNKNIEVDMFHASDSSYYIGKRLFLHANHLKIGHKFPAKKHWDVYTYIYNLGSIDYVASNRNYEVSMFLNGRFITEVTGLHQQVPKISKRIKKQLCTLKKQYQYVIGVQLFTEHNHPITRNYQKQSARNFVQACRKSGIAVINLAPCPDYRLQTNLDYSRLDITALPSLIRELDLVVGIDSCCAHIAAMMNIPSVVLHNRLYSYTLSVIRKNYNIVSKSGDLKDIPCDVIIDRIKSILEKKLLVPFDVKEQYTWDGENTEYI